MNRIDVWLRTGAALGAMTLAAGLWGCAQSPAGAGPAAQDLALAPDAARCAGLVGARIDGGRVESAERVAPGATIATGETAGAKVSTALCRVRLRLNPVADSDIRVEVWLPDTWNHKLFALGGAGFDGGLNPGGGALLGKATAQGYASVATDVGHAPVANAVSWAHGKPQAVIDFGHRGNHVAAVAAKQLIGAYYGRPAKHAYFLGCSNGGRDGVMEASRYPDDYDGVIAGAPARRYLEIVTQLISYSRISSEVPTLSSKLNLVHGAVMAKCDGLDGVKDGILENPLACKFDPVELQCKGADSAACLTSAEVDGFRRIYGGLRLKSGERVIGGPVVGSEGVPGNWGAWILSPIGAMAGQEIYRWMVFDDPNWKVETFDLDRDYPVAKARIGATINADEPDLRAFAKRGGKLIMYQGWADPAITPLETINYLQAVRETSPQAASQVRLFMVPGMMHCAGGPGANVFDMQPALEAWVEKGQAPERVVATEAGGGDPPASRPLCAWPKTAHYNGAGSTRDAANFTCKAPA
ncbi:tannase/feruloyl esterase family alpha/beta hydrolase [Caulobacter rhizosphaerae]|uniref:tannase/feruloyl esterase family alpha/beta hydrolase n=1 Tax=Caulobacter rhizosphaerae TaxID=2010972 RepID=UPI0013CFA952|nr:tannase/feruloyl esterase family alpha/beta hydrolase [Caulobacter rhizosphaerae]GGL34973.1 putative esterase [Caulobacter rhizosphaerae]